MKASGIDFSSILTYSCVLVVLNSFVSCVYSTTVSIHVHEHDEATATSRYPVAKLNFAEISEIYEIALWILLGSLAKIGFHLSHKLTEKFPESCLLVILGVLVGAFFFSSKLAVQKAYVLNSETFFLFLLPPIILEAGYFMPNRPFFDNIGTILLFAIANTLFNTLLIGVTVWLVGSLTPLYGLTEFGMLECFLFAALISAVDPVAVLSTFVEINVNDMLYIVVFGEALLNDAVSVVLYRLFDGFIDIGSERLEAVDVCLGAASFLVVACGGVLIGLVFGMIGTLTTKFTERTPVLEPLIVMTYAYIAYLTAEATSTSSILAITFCGMFMKQYVEYNISKKSSATIEYILKMAASIMETIIFMFMGLSTVSNSHSWNTGFVLVTIVACLLYRFVGVFLFSYLANRTRLIKLELSDMLIMSYGGIRGAVAFALALILDESKVPRKKEFVTATIAVVFFTVFVQGTTISPLVKYLNIKRKEEGEPTMSAKLTVRLIDHIMSGLETVSGMTGKHALRNKIRTFDRKYMRRMFVREKQLTRDEKLLNTFRKINELNMSKMAEAHPEFIFRPANNHNTSHDSKTRDRSTSPSSVLKSADVTLRLTEQPPKKPQSNIEYHYLLDKAINNAHKPLKSTGFNKMCASNFNEQSRKRSASTVYCGPISEINRIGGLGDEKYYQQTHF